MKGHHRESCYVEIDCEVDKEKTGSDSDKQLVKDDMEETDLSWMIRKKEYKDLQITMVHGVGEYCG